MLPLCSVTSVWGTSCMTEACISTQVLVLDTDTNTNHCDLHLEYVTAHRTATPDLLLGVPVTSMCKFCLTYCYAQWSTDINRSTMI